MDLPLSPNTGVLEEFDQSKTVLPSYEIIVAEVIASTTSQPSQLFLAYYSAVQQPHTVINIAAFYRSMMICHAFGPSRTHSTAQSSRFTLTPLPDLGAVQADKALALADLQVTEGFRFDAQLNYHTACVYYRVMECLVPSLTATVHKVSQLNVHLSRPIGP